MLTTNLKTTSFLIASALTGFNASATPLKGAIAQGENQSTQIVGGVEAIDKEFPFMVSLHYDGKIKGKKVVGHQCGATILNETYLLTAAHCVDKGYLAKNYTAQIGFNNIKDKKGGQRIKVRTAYIHPNYDDEHAYAHDVAVLELSKPIKLELTKPIHLASERLNELHTNTGAVLTVSGWGATDKAAKKYPDKLRKLELPVISHAKCIASQINDKDSDYRNIDPSRQLCAGYQEGGRDSCSGDSGGPLFSRIGGKFYQMGIVSWGAGCAKKDAPGVYSRTSYYKEWIDKIVKGDQPPALDSNKRGKITIEKNEWHYSIFTVPKGRKKLMVILNPGKLTDRDANVDLNVNHIVAPTDSNLLNMECSKYEDGVGKYCNIKNPQEGPWIIGLKADKTTDDLNLEWKTE